MINAMLQSTWKPFYFCSGYKSRACCSTCILSFHWIGPSVGQLMQRLSFFGSQLNRPKKPQTSRNYPLILQGSLLLLPSEITAPALPHIAPVLPHYCPCPPASDYFLALYPAMLFFFKFSAIGIGSENKANLSLNKNL